MTEPIIEIEKVIQYRATSPRSKIHIMAKSSKEAKRLMVEHLKKMKIDSNQ